MYENTPTLTWIPLAPVSPSMPTSCSQTLKEGGHMQQVSYKSPPVKSFELSYV